MLFGLTDRFPNLERAPMLIHAYRSVEGTPDASEAG
jgi:hypothetical protein